MNRLNKLINYSATSKVDFCTVALSWGYPAAAAPMLHNTDGHKKTNSITDNPAGAGNPE